MLIQNSILTYITGAPRATIGFAGRLAVRAEVLLGLRAPIDAAGELILHLAVIIHFLAAQIAAGDLKRSRRSFGGVHIIAGMVFGSLPWMTSQSFCGSSVPMRYLFPFFMDSSTASSPDTLNSHWPRPIQWMPQPHNQHFLTGRHDRTSASHNRFPINPGPKRMSTNSSSTLTVRLPNKTSTSKYTPAAKAKYG